MAETYPYAQDVRSMPGPAMQSRLGGNVPKEQTLNERLNGVSSSVTYSCERIESVLARVNGTPQSEAPGKTPAPQYSLSDVVLRLEEQAKRVIALVEGVERIA